MNEALARIWRKADRFDWLFCSICLELDAAGLYDARMMPVVAFSLDDDDCACGEYHAGVIRMKRSYERSFSFYNDADRELITQVFLHELAHFVCDAPYNIRDREPGHGADWRRIADGFSKWAGIPIFETLPFRHYADSKVIAEYLSGRRLARMRFVEPEFADGEIRLVERDGADGRRRYVQDKCTRAD